jgi:hypothetical protein
VCVCLLEADLKASNSSALLEYSSLIQLRASVAKKLSLQFEPLADGCAACVERRALLSIVDRCQSGSHCWPMEGEVQMIPILIQKNLSICCYVKHALHMYRVTVGSVRVPFEFMRS